MGTNTKTTNVTNSESAMSNSKTMATQVADAIETSDGEKPSGRRKLGVSSGPVRRVKARKAGQRSRAASSARKNAPASSKIAKVKAAKPTNEKAEAAELDVGQASPLAETVDDVIVDMAAPAPVEIWEPEKSMSALQSAKHAKSRLGRNRRPAAPPPEDANPLPAVIPPRDPWADLVFTETDMKRSDMSRNRVVGYLRYSSVTQNRNSSLRQAELIAEYCRLNNLELVGMFADEAVSGTVEDREGVDHAVKMIEDDKADIIMSEDCDRYARRHSILPRSCGRTLSRYGLRRVERSRGSWTRAYRSGSQRGVSA